MLYVPEVRRNLLSASKLAQDLFQVVLPSTNATFCPGIYNCCLNKPSEKHSIPIVSTGSLFHINACAEAEIKRHDRKDHHYIIRHCRLGDMPLDTIQCMIDSGQSLEDLRGISFPHNYVRANVRRGKATKVDQPKSNPKPADQPLQVIYSNLFGPYRHSSFAGHSHCFVLIDDCTRYTQAWVYTIKNKSDVFDVLKKFYADTAIIRSKHPLCCFR